MKQKQYSVTEVFQSIQGEGYHAGTPAFFIRFAGCNLRCPWCDTNFSPRSKMTAKQLVAAVPKGTSLIVLTGGEPTMQVDADLIDCLLNAAPLVAIETNGTRMIPEDWPVWITVSPKARVRCLLQVADEIKLVLPQPGVTASQMKAVWLPSLRHGPSLNGRPCMWVQPLDMVIYKQDGSVIVNKECAKAIQSGWGLSLQLHKLIGCR
jgi:7-carboxy-7-deazaguanine synthase